MSDAEGRMADLAAMGLTLQGLEQQVGKLRDRRNELILECCRLGYTEREVARVAGVSPSYVHRVKAHEGHPPSGPMLGR